MTHEPNALREGVAMARREPETTEERYWRDEYYKMSELCLKVEASSERREYELEQELNALKSRHSVQQAPSAEAVVQQIFEDLRDRRFLKWLFADPADGGTVILYDERGEPIYSLDGDIQDEIARVWGEFIATALRAERQRGVKAGLEAAIAWHEGMMMAHKNHQKYSAEVSDIYKRHQDMWLHHRQSKTHLESLCERAISPATVGVE